ncbi:MAG: hypothetical protein HYV97_10340 [Bdellovibrio sp.]|nr:hypothetical protein [Bdellovibrio sp.]
MTKFISRLLYCLVVIGCISCATTKTQSTSEVALDYILGHVRDTLVESKNSYGDLVNALLAETSLTPKAKKILSDKLLEFFNGQVLYKKVQDYYWRSLGKDFFVMAADELAQGGPQNLHMKERLDLNPNNYQAFLKNRKAFPDWDERAVIIDSFDELNKVSRTLMASFHNMHQILITAMSIAGTPPAEIQNLDQSLQQLEGNIQLQTMYFIKEAMKYTYQDFTKEDLLFLKTFYERPMMRQIFDRVEEAIGQAYAFQLGAFKAAYKP